MGLTKHLQVCGGPGTGVPNHIGKPFDISSKIKHQLLQDPAIPLLGVYSRQMKDLHTNVHSSFIWNSPDLEPNQMPIGKGLHACMVVSS